MTLPSKKTKIQPVDWESTVNGMTRLWRYVPPADYTLKIKSFSLFSSSNEDNGYQTSVFESGGYKWKLSLHPNGNKKRNVKDHVSLYLAIANTDALPRGWEVNVTFNFFLYNHVHDEYLTFQDPTKATTRLNLMKTEVGFDELVSLATLNDPSNGFLLEDCCIFGAEVVVLKVNVRGECISMIKDPANNTFTWNITNFSEIAEEIICSEEFVVGGHKWKLQLYPKGDGQDKKGESISLYLMLVVDVLHCDKIVFAEYELRIGASHMGGKGWFGGSKKAWGFHKFLSLKDLKKKLMNGTLTVEAEIKLISQRKDL